MFCEKCGTRIDDGAPFCPNCGNRMTDAKITPAADRNLPPAEPVAPAGQKARSPVNQATGYVNNLLDKHGREKIYHLATCCLLVICFILSLLKVYQVYGTAFSMADGAPWLLVISNILFTVMLGLALLDYLQEYSFKPLWLLIPAASCLILVLFIIKWIAGVEGFSISLSVGGWFFLILQAALVAVSILLLLEKKKK